MQHWLIPVSGPHFSSRIFRWRSCAASARVVSKGVLRVRAIRTEYRCLSGAASARRLLMPARETEAIILKTFPLGEADRLVSFLARSGGRLRGVAAGARRLKNRFGSTLELLSHVEMTYTERETRDLVRIQQCDLLESFHAAQSDYALGTGLALVSEISEVVLPEREAAEAMFRLILLTAREIERRRDWRLPLSYFAFWTVRLGGWLPRFDRCSSCGNPFEAAPAFHAAWSPGLFCQNCRRPGMSALTEQPRHLAERFTAERLDKMESVEQNSARPAEVTDASFDWIEHHTEKKLGVRELLETA